MSRHPARQMLVWALAVILQDKCWSGHLPSSCKTNAGLGTCRHPAGQMLVWALAVIQPGKHWLEQLFHPSGIQSVGDLHFWGHLGSMCERFLV